jgi:transposase
LLLEIPSFLCPLPSRIATFHLVGHDSSGRKVFRKKSSRTKLIILANIERTTVAMESCGGSHWLARKCQEFVHKALLIPPQYVKPYVKTNKNDFIDADAIADAATPLPNKYSPERSDLNAIHF